VRAADPVMLAAFRRRAPACRCCARHRRQAEDRADGRAVRRTRSADP
jgi:hypothetical protein